MRETVPAIGVAVWLLGMVVLGTRLLVGQWRMTRLRATAVLAEPDVELLCRDLATGMGVEPLPSCGAHFCSALVSTGCGGR